MATSSPRDTYEHGIGSASLRMVETATRMDLTRFLSLDVLQVLTAELTHDRTRNGFLHAQRVIALVERCLQSVSERLQLTHTRVDAGKMFGQHAANTPALLAAASIRWGEEVPDFLQLEPKLLRLVDEPKARDRIGRVHAKATLRAGWLRYQSHSLVVADRVRRQARGPGNCSNSL